MAITYIQPGAPLEADLWDNIYGELDRKINLITNNKSIIFLETGLLSSKKYYFFDGIEGRVGDLLNQNISDCLGRRVPNGNVGWYGYLFNSNNTSGEYRHSFYESLLDSTVLGSDSINGCTAPINQPFDLSESLAVPRRQSFSRVTGINIINPGSGYGEFTMLSFPPKNGFGPYFPGECGAIIGISGAINGVDFSPYWLPSPSHGVYFGSGPDTITVTPMGYFPQVSGTGFLGIPLLENVNANVKFVNPTSPFSSPEQDVNKYKLFQAELIFEGNSAFTFPKEYDKYKFFRIHNLNNSSLNFTFEAGAPPGSGMDTSAGEQFSVTIPKHSSRCVRRDFGRYTLGYVNFQKIISGDGRFDDDFPHAFNNVYDPINHALSYLNHNSISSRCTFNKTKYWNSESLYFGEGKPFKEKNDDTLYGDILYHTGDILMTHVYTGNFCSRPNFGGFFGGVGREYTPSGFFETKKISYSGGQFPLDQFLAQSGLSGIKSSDKFCLTYTGTGTNCAGDFRQTRFIKTKVHLLQNTTDFYTLCGTSGIDESLVQTQIDVLNNAFSAYNNPNPYIQFEWDQNLIITNFTGVAASGSPPSSLGTWPGLLANGPDDPPPANFDEFQTISPAINPYNFLNIWIFECTGEGCASFGNYPDTHGAPWDGVSMSAGHFFLTPCSPGYESGHLLIHEVGHYLGLSHLWVGNDRPGQTDDGISDTPDQDGPIFGCPLPPPFASDGVTRALTNNYMNYTDSECTNSFTTGQVDRMNATLDVVRNSLFSGFCTGQYARFALKETVFTPYTTNIISTQNIGSKKILQDGTTNVCVTTGSNFISSGTYFRNVAGGQQSASTYGVVAFRIIDGPGGTAAPAYSGPLIATSTYSFPVDLKLSYVSGKMMDYFSINQAQLEATGQWLEDDITQRLSGNYKFLGSELINHGFSNLILHRRGGLALNVVGGSGFPIFTFLKSQGFHLENDVIYSLEDSYSLSSSDWRSHSPRTDEYYGTAPLNNYLFAGVEECEPTPPPTKPGFPIDRAKKIYLMRNYHGGFPTDGMKLFSLNFFLESQGGIERCVYSGDPACGAVQSFTYNNNIYL